MSAGNEYQPVDRPGSFRGNIIAYKGVESREGSYGISIDVLITAIWDETNQAWDESWAEYGMVASGIINVIKKTKEINQAQCKALCEYAGWSGLMFDVFSQAWVPTPVAITVEENTWNNKTELRISWLNPYDSTPGARGGISEEQATAFDSQFGGQIRALKTNAVRNAAPPPAEKPKAPAKRPKPAPAKQAAAADADGERF